MQTVHYSTARVMAMCIAMLGFIVVGVVMWSGLYGKGAFAGAILMMIGICGLPAMARYLLGGGLILEYDRTFVTFHGVLSTTRLRWDEVTGIEIEEQTYNWIAKNRFLKIKGPFSFLGYASMTERLLARKHRPIGKLLDQITDYLESPEAAPQQPVRQTGFGSAMPDTRSTGVIGEQPVAAPQMRAGGFGRKGL
ncbi:MAG: hypothetical protein HKO08_10080 [Erythrobacter sp.]|nr:hypothetical protein [Erythrobacter sp.]